MKTSHQIGAFAGVGILAAIAHYGVLIGAVELWQADPVRASLAGFVAGGIVSYLMNRRMTFKTRRSHAEAGWRFGLVAFGGFLATGLLMGLFVKQLALPYLMAQVITTLLVMLFTFTAHKTWSFGEGR
jgi:putative flippase GtrA